MKAKNRKQYIDAWNSHINDLIRPFMDADIPMEEWYQTKAELQAIVETAAAKNFSATDEAS